MTDRYYYSILNSEEKKAYQSLYRAMSTYEKVAVVQKPLFRKIDIQKVVFSIDMDHPFLYYVDFWHLRYVVGANVISFEISYFFRKEDIATLQAEVDKVLSKILVKITGGNVYETVCSAHDVLVRNVLYDTGAVQNIESVFLRSNTILGVLFYKTAVCEGIAKTFKYLLNLREIPCLVAVGKAFGSQGQVTGTSCLHAWNLVRIEGKNFGVDATWDINASQKQFIRHDYLLLPDSMMQKDHQCTVHIPQCETQGQDFLSRSGRTFRGERQISDYVASRVQTGHRRAEFRFLTEATNPYQIVCDAVKKAFAQNTHFQGTPFHISYNQVQSVFGIAW